MWVAARYGNFAQAGGGAEATPGSGYTGWWRADGSDNLTDGGVVASGNIDSLASSPNLFSQGGTRFWNGKYADLITYNTCVSDNDATDTAARNYLSKRYALTL